MINTATSHSAADADALVDAYLFDIAVTPVWTLISDPALGLPAGIDIAANSVSTDLHYVNLTYNDGQPASVVLDRTGGTFRYAGPAAATVSDDRRPKFSRTGLVYRVGLPTLYSVAPTSIAAGTSVTFTVTGREFVGAAQLSPSVVSGLTVQQPGARMAIKRR